MSHHSQAAEETSIFYRYCRDHTTKKS